MNEYIGNIHMHTVHSDGAGTFADLRSAGLAAGLDFIIVTDHNVLVEGEEGYYQEPSAGAGRGLLVLVGAEINDEALEPPGNHLLCLGISRNPLAHAADPQALIDAVKAQGGMAFLAHPFERTGPLITDCYPWQRWDVTGFQGVELWNYMSEFRPHVTSRLSGLLLSFLPALFSAGPWPEMLAKWDELTRQRPVVAIGGSDVHARSYHVFGPIYRTAFPYAHCYRAVNTHILTETPLSGDPAGDRPVVYNALRAGHCWVGYDLIGNTRGFRFAAGSDREQAILGDTVTANSPVRFDVRLPAPADLRLLRNGQIVRREQGRSLTFTTTEPGVYRVEAWRRAWFKPRGWIFSNPIYVK